MKELLYSIIEGLVENKADICITEDAPNEEGIVVIHLNVAKEDMGRVIGKQGRIAKAIRTVLKSAGNKENVKVSLEIL